MSEGTIATWGQDAEEFGDSAPIVDKKELVGKPFLVGKVAFRKGDFGPYVTVTAVDKQNSEFLFNDGSTGVYAQIVAKLQKAAMLDTAITKPDQQEYEGVRWACNRGLRVSEYEGPGGKPARTYYIA